MRTTGQVFVAATALAIVRYIVLPFYDRYVVQPGDVLPWMDVCVPAAVHPVWKPSRDGTMNLMMLGALAGYYVQACGVCTLLDMALALTPQTDSHQHLKKRLKMQGARSFFTAVEWLQAVAVSTLNAFLFSWFVTLPTWHVHRTGLLRGGTPVHSDEEPLDLGMAIVHIIACSVIIDFWFYWTHRLLHWGPLYRSIHKMHHRFTAPTAVACMYAHPIEYCFGNVLGVVLGPALTNCHPHVACYWMCLSLVSTASSHSGYRFLAADRHDQHHEFFDYEFGTGFTDRLFGTSFEGSEPWKRLMARQKKE